VRHFYATDTRANDRHDYDDCRGDLQLCCIVSGLCSVPERRRLTRSAFTEAILVTPMGALSVVICAILSHFFLKESLTFFVRLPRL
jgi:hypothetical protein